MPDRVRLFLSHSHTDDAFARKLADDLTHADADVWVDFADIAYDDFLKKINEGLKDRQWLVLVMTPNSLRSEWVQMEVYAALLKVRKHEMHGVIPILAAPCSDKEIPALWAPLHRYDATRDYQSALAGLINALGLNVQPKDLPKSPVLPLPDTTRSGRALVVDSQGSGDYKTIAEAIEAAQEGDHIEIRAGLYREVKLEISKQLEVVGIGASPDDVVIMAEYGSTFKAPRGRLFNLMMDRTECSRHTSPVMDIEFGRPDVELCTFANGSPSGIRVGERSAPFIAGCIFQRCGRGVEIYGKPHLEGNDIGDCDEGISVNGVRDVTIRSNRVHNNEVGIHIEQGSAVLEQNTIDSNKSGVHLERGGSVLARANLISGNQSGVGLWYDGGGIFEDNDMRGNRGGAWHVANNAYGAGGSLDNVRQARNLFDAPQARR